MKLKIAIIVGARPNFMKVAPLIKEIENNNLFNYKLIHTGQHYDLNMSNIFFDELNIPKPNINLEVGSSTHANQTAQIMIKLEDIFLKDKPDLIIVIGDINSTLATALVASKLHIKLAHIESGLRSFDRDMPEEINRIITDQLSDYLFVTEPEGLKNLKNEGIPDSKQFFVGNVMLDFLSSKLSNLKKDKKGKKDLYAVITIHRPSNVDKKEDLENILDILDEVAKKYKVIWPIHPRTKKRINEFNLNERIKKYTMKDPLGYLEFINLVYNAKFIVTDSGGIQAETTFLGIPCITLRKNTEQPITITKGTNFLTGPVKEEVMKTLVKIKNKQFPQNPKIKFWDGHTAERILNILKREIKK